MDVLCVLWMHFLQRANFGQIIYFGEIFALNYLELHFCERWMHYFSEMDRHSF